MSGEYTIYIASAYAIAALVLAGLAAQSLHAWKRVRVAAEKMDRENA